MKRSKRGFRAFVVESCCRFCSLVIAPYLEARLRESNMQPVYYLSLPVTVVTIFHHTYSTSYIWNTDNPDTRPVPQKDSQKLREVEYI